MSALVDTLFTDFGDRDPAQVAPARGHFTERSDSRALAEASP